MCFGQEERGHVRSCCKIQARWIPAAHLLLGVLQDHGLSIFALHGCLKQQQTMFSSLCSRSISPSFRHVCQAAPLEVRQRGQH